MLASAPWRRACALALLSSIGVQTFAAETSAATSPARAQLQRALEAFNTGDPTTIREFAGQNFSPRYKDPPRFDDMIHLYKLTGGFDLLEVDEPEPNFMHGWVRARDGDVLMELWFAVEEKPPHLISQYGTGWGKAPQKYFPLRLSESQAIEALRADAARRAAADKFSGAVLVARGNQVLLREAYGYANRESKVANAIDTRFRTASVTKMFTAVAVLRLVQDGKVKLDDPLGTRLPEVAGKPLGLGTIHQYLSHTAGAGDLFDARYFGHQRELRTHGDYVRAFGADELIAKPGDRYQYSNLGFILLGAMIERVSGKSFYDYVQDVVFQPAGMTRTGALPEDVEVEGRATGYDRPAGTREWISAMDMIDYRPFAQGGMYSTVDDMARFLGALRSNRLLNEHYTKVILTPKVKQWDGMSYGYGMTIQTYPWMGEWIGHGGGDHGMNSDVWFSPDSNYVLVVLSNFDPPVGSQVSDFIMARLPLR